MSSAPARYFVEVAMREGFDDGEGNDAFVEMFEDRATADRYLWKLRNMIDGLIEAGYGYLEIDINAAEHGAHPRVPVCEIASLALYERRAAHVFTREGA